MERVCLHNFLEQSDPLRETLYSMFETYALVAMPGFANRQFPIFVNLVSEHSPAHTQTSLSLLFFTIAFHLHDFDDVIGFPSFTHYLTMLT